MERNDMAEVFLKAKDAARDRSGAPFVPTRMERWGVPASAVIAYVYVLAVFSEGQWARWIAAFAALLCAGAGLAFQQVPRRRECWVWLTCLWTTLLCNVFGRGRAWHGLIGLIIHGFGAYWLLTRSGGLMDGGSSRYFPADVLYGLAVLPFKRFLLRFKVMRAAGQRNGARRLRPAAIAGAVTAVIAALFLLGIAMLLLSDADPNFQYLVDRLWFRLGYLDGRWFTDFLLSLPVGAYLYAMVFGARRAAAGEADARRKGIDRGIRAMRHVPGMVWPVLLGLFAAMYMVFFAVQGSYLFGGLRSVLPEAFTAAQYARRGFFELCGVMAVNFTLLGASVLTDEGGQDNRKPQAAHGRSMQPATKWMSTMLLLQSALFAVIAASKLALYIRRFGYTPLRLQSCWLVLALFGGCIAALRALWTGRDTTKPWLIFAAVTLAATQLW